MTEPFLNANDPDNRDRENDTPLEPTPPRSPVHPIVRQYEAGTYATSQTEFFHVDEVAILRFMAMCQQSYTPDLWDSFEKAARLLISIRPGLRDDSFERLEAYLHGSHQPVLDS